MPPDCGGTRALTALRWALLDPCRYCRLVSPSLAAQLRSLADKVFVQLPLRGALEDPGHLGQQITTAAREIRERAHGGGLLTGMSSGARHR